jgi:uncharacterized membrane protein YoaK (UPF0700 family)
VDAVSFLPLGRVFTANMTGNVVILAFATALLSFLVGAILGGRIMARANAETQIQFAAQAFLLEIAFLFAASFCAIGYRGHLLEDSFQPFALIALMALAMGTRNAAVRKLTIPDLTTTVLTLTITGIAVDSSIANGNNPRLARRVGSVVAMFLGAALGAVIHTLLDLGGLVAWDSDLRFVQCGVVSLIAHVRPAVRTKLAFQLRRTT